MLWFYFKQMVFISLPWKWINGPLPGLINWWYLSFIPIKTEQQTIKQGANQRTSKRARCDSKSHSPFNYTCLRKYYRAITGLLQGYYWAITGLLLGYYRAITGLLQGYYSSQPVQGVGPQPLARWDCGFESHRGHGYLSAVSVVCCQVEGSAKSWSLIQKSPTDCGASLYVI